MDIEKYNRIKNDNGFFAALDQSGGSIPKVLSAYGIDENSYSSDEEMFELRHEMCSRMILSPAFTGEHILAVIVFKDTMRRKINNVDIVDFLWQQKRIITFLKVDEGLANLDNGVQLMKPMQNLDQLLKEAKEKHVFGTKMRSVIKDNDIIGVRQVLDQQFELANQIIKAGLLPIIEPEIDIDSKNKKDIELTLREYLEIKLAELPEDARVLLKLTLPEEDGFYSLFVNHPKVTRVLALSGGYGRDKADEKLSKNNGVIASFNRALSEGLSIHQTEDEFNRTLLDSVFKIYKASEK